MFDTVKVFDLILNLICLEKEGMTIDYPLLFGLETNQLRINICKSYFCPTNRIHGIFLHICQYDKAGTVYNVMFQVQAI